jgi:hypothetical protein
MSHRPLPSLPFPMNMACALVRQNGLDRGKRDYLRGVDS